MSFVEKFFEFQKALHLNFEYYCQLSLWEKFNFSNYFSN